MIQSIARFVVSIYVRVAIDTRGSPPFIPEMEYFISTF